MRTQHRFRLTDISLLSHVTSDSRWCFGLDIRFIDHLHNYKQLLTVSLTWVTHFKYHCNYSTHKVDRSEMVAVLGTNEALPYHIHTYIHTHKVFFVFTRRFLVTDFNSGDSQAAVLTAPILQLLYQLHPLSLLFTHWLLIINWAPRLVSSLYNPFAWTEQKTLFPTVLLSL
jgi:hypothetical protein